MGDTLFAAVTQPVPRIALSASEAAQALGISKRLLESLTADKEIPHMRIGRRVMYPVEPLGQWAKDRVVSPKEKVGDGR